MCQAECVMSHSDRRRACLDGRCHPLALPNVHIRRRPRGLPTLGATATVPAGQKRSLLLSSEALSILAYPDCSIIHVGSDDLE